MLARPKPVPKAEKTSDWDGTVTPSELTQKQLSGRNDSSHKHQPRKTNRKGWKRSPFLLSPELKQEQIDHKTNEQPIQFQIQLSRTDTAKVVPAKVYPSDSMTMLTAKAQQIGETYNTGTITQQQHDFIFEQLILNRNKAIKEQTDKKEKAEKAKKKQQEWLAKKRREGNQRRLRIPPAAEASMQVPEKLTARSVSGVAVSKKFAHV